jgi:hypothetical protein
MASQFNLPLSFVIFHGLYSIGHWVEGREDLRNIGKLYVRCCGGQEGRINFKMEIKSYIALVIGAGI